MGRCSRMATGTQNAPSTIRAPKRSPQFATADGAMPSLATGATSSISCTGVALPEKSRDTACSTLISSRGM
ncbi:hypothetical protein D3C87_2042870 [compost metagenome]